MSASDAIYTLWWQWENRQIRRVHDMIVDLQLLMTRGVRSGLNLTLRLAWSGLDEAEGVRGMRECSTDRTLHHNAHALPQSAITPSSSGSSANSSCATRVKAGATCLRASSHSTSSTLLAITVGHGMKCLLERRQRRSKRS
jgi:hypothetical protein